MRKKNCWARLGIASVLEGFTCALPFGLHKEGRPRRATVRIVSRVQLQAGAVGAHFFQQDPVPLKLESYWVGFSIKPTKVKLFALGSTATKERGTRS